LGEATASGLLLLKSSVDGTKDPHPARPEAAAPQRSTTAGSAKKRIATPRIVPPKCANLPIQKSGKSSHLSRIACVQSNCGLHLFAARD
jgi:hypothetical protein